MAGANRLHWPRRGTLQFWPRKRAKKSIPRIRSWASLDMPKLMGYVGYKAGMTHVQFVDNRKTSHTKGLTLSVPVTIIECPSIRPVSVVYYKKTIYGLAPLAEIFSEKTKKLLNIKKEQKAEPQEGYDEVRVKVLINAKTTTIGKKNDDLIEIKISGPPVEAAKYAKELLNKEAIKASEIFKEGQNVDVHAVSKGKGFQGTVKRYGVKIRQHKSEKTKRGVGTLGAWTTKRVLWNVAQPGKMGYHTRTEYNKQVLKISDKPEDINPKGGLVRYGLVRNEYLLIKGSLPGPKKRAIVLTEPLRQTSIPQPVEIVHIHRESQQ